MGSMTIAARCFILFLVFSQSIINGKTVLHRRIRSKDFEQPTQNALNELLADAKKLSENVAAKDKEQAEQVKATVEKVDKAALRMAQAGVQDIQTTAHWATVQSELRQGINTIIEAYENYIKIHDQICEKVKNFAKEIINKYQGELTVLNKMAPPSFMSNTTSSGTSGDRQKDYQEQFQQLLKYVFHRNSLLYHELDSVKDRQTQMIMNYQQTFAPSPSPPATHIVYHQPVMVDQTVTLQPTRYMIPCGDLSSDNSNPICSSSLADTAQQQANMACVCTAI